MRCEIGRLEIGREGEIGGVDGCGVEGPLLGTDLEERLGLVAAGSAAG
jgi:hypothetical protein